MNRAAMDAMTNPASTRLRSFWKQSLSRRLRKSLSWLGTPIVRPPEVVNLGVGAIRDRVVAVDGAAVVRPTLVLSVAGDHRVLDGDTLGAFVNQVAALLESPVLLFEDLR